MNGSASPDDLPASGDGSSVVPARLIDLPLGEGRTRRSYNVFFHSRSESNLQLLRFMRIEAGWRVAYRVVRLVNGEEGEVVREVVQKDYPRSASGQVEWQWTSTQEAK